MTAETAELDLKAIRDRFGWSQSQMARELGCNQSTIWRIENEKLVLRGPLKRALEMLIEQRGAA